MVTIRLTNSKTRRKEDFRPIDPANVRMYVCGPTVYDRAHLGNARPVVVFDTLFRLLRHVYGPQAVTYVRNFTDVDDKINAEALRRQKAGSPGTLEELIRGRTEETIAWYHADMDALGALRPTHEPRATEYIDEMKVMITDLMRKGYAYSAPITYGHNSRAVYFNSERAPEHSFFNVAKDATYGQLSGRSVEEMISGAKSEKGEGKRNPMDFVLWKPSRVEEPGWESPWGVGRPGWHIECSAMSKALLGKVFDIHGGGIDLQFPHHENEIAQSCCANDTDTLANYWLHNEMLQVEGKKMSKSLGNFFTVRDLLDQGVPGEVIRFVLLMTHYRSPMDWTAEKARQAKEALRRFYSIAATGSDVVEPDSAVIGALADDLNTSRALTELHRLATPETAGTLRSSLVLLGLMGGSIPSWAKSLDLHEEAMTALRDVLRERKKARDNKDFTRADFIRDVLSSYGVSIADLPDGKIKPTTSFDKAAEFFGRLSSAERSELMGPLYDASKNRSDGHAVLDVYLKYVAEQVAKQIS